MAVDLFLKVDSIPGESKDNKHPNEIVLESYSWGESNHVLHSIEGGPIATSRVAMQDFHFTMRISKATPRLMLACASGQRIKSAVMTARRAGAMPPRRAGPLPFEFLTYSFTGVLVTSVEETADSLELPLDQASLAFDTIVVEYREQKPDGSVGEIVKFGWDLAKNKPK